MNKVLTSIGIHLLLIYGFEVSIGISKDGQQAHDSPTKINRKLRQTKK